MIKKLLSSLILSIMLSMSLCSAGTVFADTSGYDLAKDNFNVGEVLTLNESKGDKKQASGYFSDAAEGGSPLVSFILTIINFATAIIGSIAVLIMIVTGFRLMAAQGEQEAINNAKEHLKYAVIALILAFSSYIIVIFAQSLFISN
jgi:hypothetical protein